MQKIRFLVEKIEGENVSRAEAVQTAADFEDYHLLGMLQNCMDAAGIVVTIPQADALDEMIVSRGISIGCKNAVDELFKDLSRKEKAEKFDKLNTIFLQALEESKELEFVTPPEEE